MSALSQLMRPTVSSCSFSSAS